MILNSAAKKEFDAILGYITTYSQQLGDEISKKTEFALKEAVRQERNSEVIIIHLCLFGSYLWDSRCLDDEEKYYETY